MAKAAALFSTDFTTFSPTLLVITSTQTHGQQNTQAYAAYLKCEGKPCHNMGCWQRLRHLQRSELWDPVPEHLQVPCGHIHYGSIQRIRSQSFYVFIVKLENKIYIYIYITITIHTYALALPFHELLPF